MRPETLASISTLAAGKPHGVRLRYMSGCRCMLCRAANSRYETERDAARKNGDWNGIISAARARKHLLALKRIGIGHRLVSEASGVGRTAIQRIRSGKKQFIRARTERLILSVDRNVRGSASLVPAGPTWKLIAELIEEGFTKAELAKRLGNKSPALQFRRDFVTAKTEQKVARFYSQIMEGA